MRSKRDKHKVKMKDSSAETVSRITEAMHQGETSLRLPTMHRGMMQRLAALTRYIDFLMDDINYLKAAVV